MPKKERTTITILFVYNTILWFLLLQHLVLNFRTFAITSTMRMFDNMCDSHFGLRVLCFGQAKEERKSDSRLRRQNVFDCRNSNECRKCHHFFFIIVTQKVKIIFTSRFACHLVAPSRKKIVPNKKRTSDIFQSKSKSVLMTL